MSGTMKAVRVHQVGGVDKMQADEIPIPEPKEGQVVVKNTVIGVNFIDCYHRSGLYKMPLPFCLGREGVGTVSAVSSGVQNLKVGDRVIYVGEEAGYAEYTAVKNWKAFKIPDAIKDKDAMALGLQGMTAHYLANSTFDIKSSDTVLILAAAGGVGQLLVQMAKLKGATVIAVVSTKEKEEIVKGLGADHVINHKQQKIDVEVKKITQNKGVNCVYDSVGAATWEASLNSLKPRGLAVFYGNASGPIPPLDINKVLSEKGSLYVTRPTLAHYTLTPEEYTMRLAEVFTLNGGGQLKTSVEHVYKLSEAAKAHTDIESGKTTGKLVLIPDALWDSVTK